MMLSDAAPRYIDSTNNQNKRKYKEENKKMQEK